MPPRIDLTGKPFGRLKVLEATEMFYKELHWKCVCECGKEINVSGHSLRSGNTTSCGCYRLERFKEVVIVHGMSRTKIYKVWAAMIQRCENPKDNNYPNYGGRGIYVIEEWHNFENFYAWVLTIFVDGIIPKGLTLDRKDNDGPYSPDNCRYATRHDQNSNQRKRRCVVSE